MSQADKVQTFKLSQENLVQQLTRFKIFVNKVLQDKTQISGLKIRLDSIKPILNTYGDIHINLINIDPDNRESYYEQLELFETSYFELIVSASDLLETIQDTQYAQVVCQANSQFNAIVLPQIDLPTFSGDTSKWLEFHDTFLSLIDDNESLSKVQKFYYLKSCLKKDAEAVISALKVTNDNYTIAWDLLKDRFQNDKLIINSHVQELCNLPMITKESFSMLRKMLDDVKRILRVLQNFKQPVDQWDLLLIHLISSKLDFKSRKAWELSNLSTNLPTMCEFFKFISDRCALLETMNSNLQKGKMETKTTEHRLNRKTFVTSRVNSAGKCYFCNQEHLLYYCADFLKLSIEERRHQIKSLNLCFNCLKQNHQVGSCTSKGCRNCGQRHNTLLHLKTNPEGTASKSKTTEEVKPADSQNSLISIMSSTGSTEVLLATAIVDILDNHGNCTQARALLDSGSQSNLMTKGFAEKLKLSTNKVNIPVVGINQGNIHITESTQTKLKSRVNSYQVDLSFLILDKITEDIPTAKINLKIPSKIKLADNMFYKPGKIDILLGASLFYDLMCIGQIKGNSNHPTLQKTKLGWIVSGNINQNQHSHRICNLVREPDLQCQLQNFWELEECTKEKFFSQEEQDCENEFKERLQVDEIGRFKVPLLIKGNIDDLGSTYDIALKRFQNLERKLERNPNFREHYIKFMQEYESLGHMTPVTDEKQPNTVNYLPHHGVWKEDSTTTKLRVVFDGSCASTSGVSLNDRLKVGPTIQQDIFSILVRFRKHNIVLTADIEKMYRQVLVQDDYRDLQRIFWRSNNMEEIKQFQLTTVTYGTSIAPYLAVRCLHQVGLDTMEANPILAKIITEDFYVDDLLTGANTIKDAIHIKSQLQETLGKVHFNLRKWTSNSQEITNMENGELVEHLISDDGACKTLGLLWNSRQDILYFTTTVLPTNNRVTKRIILSSISKTFDPLGLVGPCIIKAKLIMQKLWKLNLSWDESVPNDIHTEWLKFQNTFVCINKFNIPRQVVSPTAREIQIHGYSDASEQAYGACVYARSTHSNGTHVVKLICAKSKVAPLKSISLPKLELCGALLLSRLVSSVVKALDMNVQHITYWCDSQITLAWIGGEPYKWKTFISNRVAEIQQLSSIDQWRHVAGKENPADIISRGLEPEELANSELWWNASPWLSKDEEFWPKHHITVPDEIPERKVNVHVSTFNRQLDIFTKYSSLTKLQRVMAYVFRFIKNCKTKKQHTGYLTVEELEHSLNFLIKQAQFDAFPEEISILSKNKSLLKGNRISSLNPFIDKEGILRVGGRLENAINLSFNQKFPIILAPNHPLTDLLIQFTHYQNLHAGPTALLSIMRQKYWPISGKTKIKSILRKCIVCFRARPITMQQLMGNLPKERITPSRPFSFCGTDFAGPFNIKANKLRNTKLIKVYLCIFVCFSTKATHLELVSDMSTDAFLNCVKRFISRRGKPAKIFSDNGTNFIGANSALKEFLKILSHNENEIGSSLAAESITWSFIPSRSPHQGGIWESAVKAAKHHLYRVLNVNFTPTFEILHTIVSQIEACLNSRPLTPLSSDPRDLQALTPGHFLIGAPLTAIPEPDLQETNISRLNQYQQATQVLQQFWSRWSVEYISTLQQRTKWKIESCNLLKPGTLVILKEDNLPPLKWKLGRVQKLFPGADGLIRVVSVKTQHGEVRRTIQKLCVLPIDN